MAVKTIMKTALEWKLGLKALSTAFSNLVLSYSVIPILFLGITVHVMNRTDRRCCLMGKDPLTGKITIIARSTTLTIATILLDLQAVTVDS